MRRTISTIGYEGLTLNDFVAALRVAGIETLIDVRAVALSRKKGFSKTSLAAALESHGIRYVHLRGLGDPKEGREAARAGDYRRFERVFAAHMRTSAAKSDLEEACAVAESERVCLMCYEADHEHCHRRIVAEAMAAGMKAKVQPIRSGQVLGARLAA